MTNTRGRGICGAGLQPASRVRQVTNLPHILLGLLLVATTAVADDTPPAKGRPVRFSGAVGNFRATMQVERAEVRVNEPFLLILRITALGPASDPPKQPDLRDLSNVNDAFHIESLSGPGGTRPDDHTWEFQYRLRAKSTAVDGVPSLPFVYYKPASSPGTRGAYQTTYAPRVPLTVKPAEAPPVTHREGGKPFTAPESVYEIATGPSVLRRPFTWNVPVISAGFILVAAPLACVVWYFVWKRWYPDAARLAHRQRSQAAQQALSALAALKKRPAPDRPRAAAEAVVAFLRHRADLPLTLPSPEEVESHLRRTGLTDEVAATAARFIRDTDAARFAPIGDAATDWADAGSRVVLLVEAESCSPSSSS